MRHGTAEQSAGAAEARFRVLFLSRWYPYPPDNGSKTRVFHLIEGLSEEAEVTLISFAGGKENLGSASPPKRAPCEIRVSPYQEFDPWRCRALIGLLGRTPRYLTDTFSPEMATLIQKAVRGGRYDVVVASQLSMAAYRGCFVGVPAVFDEVELGLFRPEDGTRRQRLWSTLRERLTWEKHRRYVAGLVGSFRACTVASERERELLSEVAPGYGPVHVVPNCIDIDACRRPTVDRAPDSLIFAGSFSYRPNYEAIAWFLREVYPSIRSKAPRTRLTITGDLGAQPRFSIPGVVQTGRVADVHTLIASSAVSIVPLRKGGGTRLKILESIANRTPVVTTSKGVEGLDLRGGEHVLTADTPEEFARAVVKALHDPEYSRDMAESAFRFIRSRYDRAAVVPEFARLVRAAAAS